MLALNFDDGPYDGYSFLSNPKDTVSYQKYSSETMPYCRGKELEYSRCSQSITHIKFVYKGL